MLAAVDAAERSVALSSYIFDIWCRLGSANWDPCSLRLNFELNMIAIGKGTKEAWPKPGQLPLDDVMLVDRFRG